MESTLTLILQSWNSVGALVHFNDSHLFLFFAKGLSLYVDVHTNFELSCCGNPIWHEHWKKEKLPFLAHLLQALAGKSGYQNWRFMSAFTKTKSISKAQRHTSIPPVPN